MRKGGLLFPVDALQIYFFVFLAKCLRLSHRTSVSLISVINVMVSLSLSTFCGKCSTKQSPLAYDMCPFILITLNRGTTKKVKTIK